MVEKIFARLEVLSKKKKVHWLDQILLKLWDGDDKEQDRLGRLILDMIPGRNPTAATGTSRPPHLPESEADEDYSKSGPNLPPMDPDPARLVPFKPNDE